MDLDAQVRAFVPGRPLAEASTPPASWYTSPAVDALERTAVFGATWQPVARTAQLAEVGDYVAVEVAGEPLLVVRGEQGLVALSNVCRHKATPVARGCGRARELVCPYHGWRYALDGRLTRAPRLGARADFSREALALPRLAVATWGPFVFVNGDPSAPPLAGQVAGLNESLEARQWSALRWAGTRSWDVACNWKVFCDNYLDGGYHIAHMHPSLDAQLAMGTYETRTFDRYSVQASRGADGLARQEGGALYAWLYPNFMINRYGPVLDTNLVLPLGPDRCRVVFEYFFEAGCDAAFVAASMRQTEVTQEEDILVSEQVQVGLGSAGFDRAPYAAPEVGILHFHELLAADLRAGLRRAGSGRPR